MTRRAWTGWRSTPPTGCCSIGLDRPSRKNALDVAAIARIVEALERPRPTTRCGPSCCAGTGDDFCAGADWVASNTAGGPRPRTGSIQRRTPLQAHRLIELLVEVQLPVVCAVRGWAAGLGCQIALAADFTVAAESSRFWEPFLRRGFTPDSGATWLLPRLVGVARAKELLLLGRELSGAEAAGWGLDPPGRARRAARRRGRRARRRAGRRADRRPRPDQALHPPRARELAGRGDGGRGERARAELAHRRLQGGPGRVPRGPGAAVRGPVSGETAAMDFETIRYEVSRPHRHDHAEPARPAERAEPGDDRRAPPGVRRRRGRRRRLDAPRHRHRAGVLHRRRRRRDPRRRPGRLRRAVPLDVPAVGGAAGGHPAVPHDDEADPRRRSTGSAAVPGSTGSPPATS